LFLFILKHLKGTFLMNTSFPEVQHGSPHLESLQKRIDQTGESIDSLIIAHNDDGMIRQLVDAKGKDCVAVCPMAQFEWHSHLPEVVAWAVDAGIDEILIVGHSHGVQPPEAFVVSDNEGGSQQTFTERLLSGVRKNSHEVTESRRHFASQMMNLVNSADLMHKECNDKFRLHTLFFIAESGSFMRYNVNSSTFQPVV